MRKTNKLISDAIVDRYFTFLDKHLKDIVEGHSQEFLTLKKIANEIAISHQHLIDIVKKSTGKPPRYFYETKVLEEAKKMLINQDMKPVIVAHSLTYDPSNFSKFFKKWTGKTPGQYKQSIEFTENITLNRGLKKH